MERALPDQYSLVNFPVYPALKCYVFGFLAAELIIYGVGKRDPSSLPERFDELNENEPSLGLCSEPCVYFFNLFLLVCHCLV